MRFRSTKNVIRLALRGCTNRPFYNIVVMRNRQPRDKRVRDQIGVYDPMPNIHNEKLVAINFSKLTGWMSHGAVVSQPVEILLGYAGFFPIHPITRLKAFRKLRDTDKVAATESNTETQQTENTTDSYQTENTTDSDTKVS